MGRLSYIRTHGRPDIEFAVGKIARYVLYPHKKVINAVNKIIRYVYQTKDRPLIFRREKKPRGITVFTDSSHATEYDLLSRHGYLVFYGRNLIGYGSRKSTIACASSSTAELDTLKVGEEVGALFGQQVKEITGSDISLYFYICQKMKHCFTFIIYNDVQYNISSLCHLPKRKEEQTELTDAPSGDRSR